MKRLVLCMLLLVPLLVQAAQPQVKVRARLVPADSVMVGGTLDLQVDLLVDTWFSSAPRLPDLKLEGAVVSQASSEATHLNEKIDGTPFFGLRFTYQITPQQARSFEIPALDIQVEPGQGSGLVSVQTSAQHFVARQPAGAADGEGQRLVAQQVEFTQTLTSSHQPLRVGDSVVRQLKVKATGAQAMLIPPPLFVEIDGLKRYVQSPTVAPLSDGRGGISGGSREDGVSYVIGQAGKFELPAIELHWWDAASGEARTSSVPALTVEASAAASYRAPFSITDDLRALGQKTQVRIARHWLLLLIGLVAVGGLAYAARSRGADWLLAWKRWREARRQAWLDSPEYAWQQVRGQLESSPAQLSALYLWTRRMSGCRQMRNYFNDISATAGKPLLVFFRSRYGRERSEDKTQELVGNLPALHEAASQRSHAASGSRGLKPLNP